MTYNAEAVAAMQKRLRECYAELEFPERNDMAVMKRNNLRYDEIQALTKAIRAALLTHEESKL